MDKVNIEVDVWVRDVKTNEVISKVLSEFVSIEPNQRLEIWVNDSLKYEEDIPERSGG